MRKWTPNQLKLMIEEIEKTCPEEGTQGLQSEAIDNVEPGTNTRQTIE
jgi:hypothetical protein